MAVRKEPMLRDAAVVKAIASLLTRAERAEPAQQRASYVDPGTLVLLENAKHQIFYGRRGTGKTHILASLGAALRERQGAFVVEVDCGKLGDTKSLTSIVTTQERCYGLFLGLLSQVYNRLLSQVLDVCPERGTEALQKLEELGRLMTQPLVRERGKSRSLEESEKRGDDFSLEIGAGAKSGFNIKGKASDTSATEAKRKTSWDLESEDVIQFPAVQTVFDEFFETTRGSLYLLLDEWSSIQPYELQPYVAEFVKRTLFRPDVTVKIAAIEQRSIFSLRDKETIIAGFELGSDIATDLVIDAHYVYEANPKQLTQRFADIALKHLQLELGEYLAERYLVVTSSDFVDALFANRTAFDELVRRAEGVARDFINIFIKAALAAYRDERRRIGVDDVVREARAWYAQDKVNELQEDLAAALERIVDLVWRRHRSRYFYFPVRRRHWAIDRLFDARVLHLVKKNHFDEPTGKYFDIYAIDYGAIADPREAGGGGAVPPGDGELVKPFGSKRAEIRRVILHAQSLDADRESPFVETPVGDVTSLQLGGGTIELNVGALERGAEFVKPAAAEKLAPKESSGAKDSEDGDAGDDESTTLDDDES